MRWIGTVSGTICWPLDVKKKKILDDVPIWDWNNALHTHTHTHTYIKSLIKDSLNYSNKLKENKTHTPIY